MIVRVLSVFIINAGLCLGQCDLPQALRDEIRSYQTTVDLIIKEVVNGPRSGILFNDLADFVDNFGPRMIGTPALESGIDDVIKRQEAEGLKVTTHKIVSPSWSRGEASAAIITPRYQQLNILTLGNTVSTPDEGITAQVVVVKDFDELEASKNEIPGKIVLVNAEFVSYAATGIFRNQGPNKASLLGAAAVLVRSITPFSINSPHTGGTTFDNEALRIPAAAVTIENANLISRLTKSGTPAGKNVTITFKSTAKVEEPAKSRNVIGDIVGSTKPQEYVVISGHIDSWDVGQGAMDDAGGAFLAWHSLALIKALGLDTPARTIRSILWTAEEPGAIGALAYRAEREEEARNWTAAFESDLGIFKSVGIGFSGSDNATCIMQEIVSLLKAINATEIIREPTAGPDISQFQDLGIPLGEPFSRENNYFWFHHSDGDWVDLLKTEDLDQNLAIFTSLTYILSNLSVPLPRE